MRSPPWLACLALCSCATPRLAASVWEDAPAVYPRHLERPIFSGGDGDAVARLNRWVNDQWGEEHGCPPSQSGPDASYDRRLTVVRYNPTVALFLDAAEYYCPGSPHPDSYRVQYLVSVASGKTVDLWARLPDAAKRQVRAKLSELGTAAHRNDPCAQAWPAPEFPERVDVRLEGERVELEPAFPHVVRACTETWQLPRSEFRAWFASDAEVTALLDALSDP